MNSPIPDEGEATDSVGGSQDLIPVDDVADMVESILKVLEPKVNPRPVFSLSGLRQEQIEKLHLIEGPSLKLITNSRRLDEECVRGEDPLWSHDTLYRQLCLLQSSVARTEASARTFIDSIFYRAAAILSSRSSDGKRVVLGLALPIEATVGNDEATLKGFVDYAIFYTRNERALSFMRDPLLSKIRLHSDSVFVSLGHQLPQSLGEMYACSSAVNKKIIRGALTNGHSWIFLLLKVHPNGQGGTYSVSQEISIMTPGPDYVLEVNSNACAQVSVVLASWIEKSFDDLDSSEWFSPNVQFAPVS
ncbi:hypothetical protein HGRIS_013895 [Hohenbuehelia grisea]|uniref:Uncharacterized protein n=1 Tax=Hohenbuehelia grisea TaxID=104357 RepID=A0ABR3IX18_9AGAR